MEGRNIAFFGSGLLSACGNGAAACWRGIIRAMHERGHRITFYESDACRRRQHREIEPPDWARVVVYSSQHERAAYEVLEDAKSADVLVKCSGVGVFDDLLEAAIPEWKSSDSLAVYWDVDATATLERIRANPLDPLRAQIGRYDLVLTYGGGDPVVRAYNALGARRCVPIYNALDPQTHHPVAPDPRFAADLGLMASRLPDRETRVEEFFFKVAERLPDKVFLLGGNGWQDRALPANVKYVGHVHTKDHNAFNCTPTAVLNIARDSMARFGVLPATRLFEAAGAGGCLITDDWQGIGLFLEPDREILVARDGAAVAEILAGLAPPRARQIGQAARQRVLDNHTYAHRAEQLDEVFASVRALPAAQRPAASATNLGTGHVNA